MKNDLIRQLPNFYPKSTHCGYHELISDPSSTICSIKSDIITSFYSFIITHDKKNLIESLKNAKKSSHCFTDSFRTDEVIYDNDLGVDIFCSFKFLYGKKSLVLHFTIIENNQNKIRISRAKPGPIKYHALHQNLVELEDIYNSL